MSNFSRRDFLGAGIAAGAGLAGLSSLAGCATSKPAPGSAVPAAAASAAPAGRKRVLRVAHLTDIHVQPELAAGEGLAQCLAHVNAQQDKPDLILTGGDLIMDGYGADEARTKLQWELFTKTFRDHNALLVEHTLGNHDIWGWHKKDSKCTGSEPKWGKVWALEQLGLEKPYRSFDVNGWHVVVLDSVQHHPADPNGYIGQLGKEQFDWLRQDLAGVPKGRHTLVVSHIPVFSVTVLCGKPEKDGNYKVSGGEMLTDSHVVRDVFEKSGTVRAALSGHIHRLDRVDFRGVSYLCNGAVSGSWWKGPQAEAFEGYALVDCYDDGSVEREYVGYGWKARG